MNTLKLKNDIEIIMSRPYETRTNSEHQFVVEFLSQFFPTLSAIKLKLMSFYFRVVPGPLTLNPIDYRPLSFLINGINHHNPEAIPHLQQISKYKKPIIQHSNTALFLDYLDYLNCQVLGQTTIEDEMTFMQSSQYFCSVPKKRIYTLLRNCKVIKFSQGSTVYYEGQKIQPGESGSGVYLVRKGEFGYFRSSSSKQIQTKKLTKGHLFGTLELGVEDKRVFTLKCKSSTGIVYNFTQQMLNLHIKPYCEPIINLKQSKLKKFLTTSNPTKTILKKNPSLGQTITEGPLSLQTSTSLYETKPTLPAITKLSRLSHQLETQSLKKSNYFSLTKQGPLRSYPLASRRSTFVDSQFRQFQKMDRDREKGEQQKNAQSHSVKKGEILFTFFRKNYFKH